MYRSILLALATATAFLACIRSDAADPSAAVLPDTAPGKLMTEWLQVVNTADPAKLAAFVRDHYGPAVLRGRQPEHRFRQCQLEHPRHR